MNNVRPQMHPPDECQRIGDQEADGMGGLPLVGDPDSVSRDMARLAALRLGRIAISFINYLDELRVAAPGAFRVARQPATARRRIVEGRC
jgi:hypothetical protein